MFATLRSKLFASYIFLVLLCLLLVGLAAGLLVSAYQRSAQITSLHSQAVVIRQFMERDITAATALSDTLPGVRQQRLTRQLDTDLRQAVSTANIRLMLITKDGVVREDSDANSSDNLTGKNFEPQPGSILTGVQTQRTKAATNPNIIGETADNNYIYVAAEFAPLIVQRGLQYVVVMQPVTSAWERLLFPMFLVGLLALLLSMFIAWLLGRNISRPIQKISIAANRIAHGDLTQRIEVVGEDEVAFLAQNFNIMAAEVQRTQQAQRDFLANVSHDLKTPLTSIQGFSQAIVDGTLPDITSAQGAARVINDESLRMGRLVSALLELSRLQSGQLRMNPQPLDLGALLRATVDGLQPQAAAKDVSLGSGGLLGLPQIMGDPDRLRQVFTNLVDNAVKHTPSGGWVQVVAQLAASAQPASPSSIVITVSDSGEGIPPADLPRIFERFYQVEKSRANDGRGLGLGLAISKEIIEAHQGSIAANSELGKGTTFTITLPTIAALTTAPTLQLRPATTNNPLSPRGKG